MVTERHHDLVWTTAAPLRLRGNGPSLSGSAASLDEKALFRPAILRFESDAFMEDLFALCAQKPTAENPRPLAARVAVWRRFGGIPEGEAPDYLTKKPANAVLKLFQPVHGHFHLVVASLVCDVVGRPDHSAPPAQVGFVLRRLSQDQDTEYSWISLPPPAADAAPKGDEQALSADAGHAWKKVPNGGETALLPGEVVLPAFAVPFSDERGHPRKLWAALVPASNPEVRLLAGMEGDGPPMGRRFVLRAVHTRPDCPLPRRYVMSERTEVFTIASFADPDAPSRPVLIPMPKIPTVRKLLGRFPKKAKFVAPTSISATDANTVSEVGGEIWVMAIPILTFCAYAVLSIFLVVLNLIFFWLPFVKFRITLPAQAAPEEE